MNSWSQAGFELFPGQPQPHCPWPLWVRETRHLASGVLLHPAPTIPRRPHNQAPRTHTSLVPRLRDPARSQEDTAVLLGDLGQGFCWVRQ